jgi:hypothetical protein
MLVGRRLSLKISRLIVAPGQNKSEADEPNADRRQDERINERHNCLLSLATVLHAPNIFALTWIKRQRASEAGAQPELSESTAATD